MRGVAAQAGVDVALVAHYFGNKESLFVATLQLPEGVDQLLVDALSGPPSRQGERLTAAYLGLWESPSTGEQMRVLARTALGNEVATDRVRGLLTELVGDPRAIELLKGRKIGFSLAMSHLLGTAFARYLVQAPVLIGLDFQDLVNRVAPIVQKHLSTGD
jgi:AcrR family transcriptional regulator